MATDLLLDDQDGNWITLSAAVVNTSASDVMIDNPDRRLPDSPTYRRALVHDEADGLTINFSDDYPGGVTLTGVVSLTPKEVSKGEVPDLTLPPRKIPWDPWEGIGDLIHTIPGKILTDVLPGDDPRIPHIPSLKIEGGIQFVWNHGGLLPTGESTQPVDLQGIIEDLRAQILELQTRLEALGG
jgi:hypothetical protein